MVDRGLIPFLGDKTVRQRLREIDKELVSILVVISIGFSKIFEGWTRVLMEIYPVVVFGVDISAPIWWTVYTLFWIGLYIFEADRKLKDGAEAVADKAEETKENVSEAVSEEEE